MIKRTLVKTGTFYSPHPSPRRQSVEATIISEVILAISAFRKHIARWGAVHYPRLYIEALRSYIKKRFLVYLSHKNKNEALNWCWANVGPT